MVSDRRSRPRWVAVIVLLGGAGCYNPRVIDCASACAPAPELPCARGMSCSNGLCTRGPVCPPQRPDAAPMMNATCVRNALRCADGQVQRCDQNATWQAEHPCAAPEPACFVSTCVTCLPGSVRCDDTGAVQRCSSAGSWSQAGKCLGAAQCSGGLCAAPSQLLGLSAGQGHTCAVVGDRAKCWGDNSHGQLGIGDGNPRGILPTQMGDNLPFVALDPAVKVVAVSAGGTHSCALLITGQVRCWGDNFYGQLGVGDRRTRGLFPEDLASALPAVKLGDGRVAVAISAGRAHTCALLSGAQVICWGDNRFGQLGVGDQLPRGTGETAANALAPIALGTSGSAIAISAGANHSCALLDNGRVKCWGANDNGELGQGDTRARGGAAGEMGDQLLPIDLGPNRIAIAVAAGGFHTCALLENGSVKCWGAGTAGQLGIGAPGNRGKGASELGGNLPTVDLGTGRTAVALASGGAHSCALLSDGMVKCWGANLFGQLGLGDVRNRGAAAGEPGEQPPIDLGLSGIEPLRAGLISASGDHTCALLANGEVKCWGLNRAGQLGQGDTSDRGDGAGELGDSLHAIRLVGP